MSDLSQPVDWQNDSTYFRELQANTGWGAVLKRFVNWIEPQEGWTTLDVGCGPGLLPRLFNDMGCQAFGIDIDPAMFQPEPLHPDVVMAHAQALPFPHAHFNLITCSNLLFFIDQPQLILKSLKGLLRSDGIIALINPSEMLSLDTAEELIHNLQLEDLARDSLINFAKRAERNQRWTEAETSVLLDSAGLTITGTLLTMGPGFVRFTLARPA